MARPAQLAPLYRRAAVAISAGEAGAAAAAVGELADAQGELILG